MEKVPSTALPRDYLNRRAVGIGAACAAGIFILFLTWDYWYLQMPLNTAETENRSKEKDLPFGLSSKHLIFETGSGGFLKLTPTKPVSESVLIKILLDNDYLIDSISSFKVDAFSTNTVFIPIHSKNVAGHCVISFKTSSKIPELENLFKQRIKIRVVHQIAFGYLSIVLGWAYFCAWSGFYYPQIYKNWKRKSVVGFSFDFLALNITGHLCYCVFNAAMYYNSQVQKQYTRLHPRGELPVHFNDLVFSINAITMNVILVIQCMIYERGDQKVSLPMWTLVGGLWVTIAITLFVAIMENITWLQYLYYLSYIKVGTTPIKYTPQVYLHFVTKSTEGWSIYAVICDAAGGFLSFLQMGVDTVNNDDWDATLGNPGKLCLGCIAMIYSSIFLLQHYVLYRPVTRKRKVTEPTKEDHHQAFWDRLETLKKSFPIQQKEVRYQVLEL